MAQIYTDIQTPVGTVRIASEGNCVTGLWFAGQKHFAAGLHADASRGMSDVLRDAINWVERYFSGIAPGTPPPLRPYGTDFQMKVWQALRSIPYGQTVTYGELAERVGSHPRPTAGAVGRNPISLMIPCHRVVAAYGLGGFAAGLSIKHHLLRLERPL